MLTAHNCWSNFGRGHYEAHIFKVIQWMFKINSILSAGGNHFQESRNNLFQFGRIHHKHYSY